MITRKEIIKHIGVYVITVDGHSTAMLYTATKKDVQYLYENGIFVTPTKLAPTFDPKKQKVVYPKGHTFQVQDYDRIVELLTAAQGKEYS
jgi:hypothetical protein